MIFTDLRLSRLHILINDKSYRFIDKSLDYRFLVNFVSEFCSMTTKKMSIEEYTGFQSLYKEFIISFILILNQIRFETQNSFFE